MMAARGRKRKTGERFPSGENRRDPRDMDTIARIKYRQAVMGDPSLSPECPLSILLARDKITREQYQAGVGFAALWVRVFGSVHASGPAWARMVKEEHHPDAEPRRHSAPPTDRSEMMDEANCAAAVAVLQRLPAPTWALVHAYAVKMERDYYVMAILRRERSGNAQFHRTALIRTALQELADLDRIRCGEDEVIANPLRIKDRSEPAPRVA